MRDLRRLGAELWLLRKGLDLTPRQAARKVGRSPRWLEDLEDGHAHIDEGMIARFAVVFGVDAATRDRWCGLAQVLPPDLVRALFEHPERWGEVRRLLKGESQ